MLLKILDGCGINSGYGREEDRQRALASGFDHHLIKPVDYEALKALKALIVAPSPP